MRGDRPFSISHSPRKDQAVDTITTIFFWLGVAFVILIVFLIIGVIINPKPSQNDQDDQDDQDDPLNITSSNQCPHCDEPGGKKTFQNQASMPIDGRVQCIDYCIHHIVAALNAGGVRTLASCCGHKKMPGRIDLEDGRILEIKQKG